MAGLDPATQLWRVCTARRLFRRADARRWVAASRAAMVIKVVHFGQINSNRRR
jgi:hypothetical protein